MWVNTIERLSAAWATLTPVLVDAAIKGMAALMLAGLAATAMRRASAAARHLVWFLGIVALLLMPVLSAALPGWHVLPQQARLEPVPVVQQRPAEPAPQFVTPSPRMMAPLPDMERPANPPTYMPPVSPVQPPIPATPPAPPADVAPPPVATPAPSLTVAGWLMLAWLAGAGLLLARLLLGHASLWLLARSAKHLADREWNALLRQLREQLGIARSVELLQSPRRSMPMTWGIRRTRVLLPADANTWPAAQQRAVLLHELAHARRRDCLTQLVTQIACALHWFNPLAWLAGRRMAAERERACDDLVLSSGTAASAYARQLLEVVSGARHVPLSAAAIAMGRPSKLEGRVRAILDLTRNRKALTRWGALVAVIATLALVIPMACLRGEKGTPGAAPQPDTQSVATEKRLISDPVAAIRLALPQGIVVQNVREDSHPFYLEKGHGLEILIGKPVQPGDLRKTKSDLQVWIMPAGYEGRDPEPGAVRQAAGLPRKVATLADAVIFMYPGGDGNLAQAVLGALSVDVPKDRLAPPLGSMLNRPWAGLSQELAAKGIIAKESPEGSSTYVLGLPDGMDDVYVTVENGVASDIGVLRTHRLAGFSSKVAGEIEFGADVAAVERAHGKAIYATRDDAGQWRRVWRIGDVLVVAGSSSDGQKIGLIAAYHMACLPPLAGIFPGDDGQGLAKALRATTPSTAPRAVPGTGGVELRAFLRGDEIVAVMQAADAPQPEFLEDGVAVVAAQTFKVAEFVGHNRLDQPVRVTYRYRVDSEAPLAKGQSALWVLGHAIDGVQSGIAYEDTPANRQMIAEVTRSAATRPAFGPDAPPFLLPGARVSMVTALGRTGLIVAVCQALEEGSEFNDEVGVNGVTQRYKVVRVIAGAAPADTASISFTRFDTGRGTERQIRKGQTVIWIAEPGGQQGQWRGLKALLDVTENRDALRAALAAAAPATRPATRPGERSELPRGKDIDRIVKDLWQMAEASELQVRSIKPLQNEPADGQWRQPLFLKLSGEAAGYRLFLGAIGKLPYVTVIEQKEKQVAGANGAAIEVEVTVAVAYEPDGPAPAGRGTDAWAREQLDKLLPEVKFDKVGFSDVVKSLKDTGGVNIWADWKRLEPVGITKESPVTVHLRDVKLSKALRAVLDDLGGGEPKLGYVVEEGLITISTAQDIKRSSVSTRVYDMRDLLVMPHDEPVPAVWVRADERPAPPATTQAVDDRIVKDLIRLLEQTVDPDSWKPKSDIGSIKELHGQFIITQAAENHRQIEALLNQLREERAVQVTIDGGYYLVPAARNEAFIAATGFDPKNPLGVLIGDEAAFRRKANAVADISRIGQRMTLFNGQRWGFANGDTRQLQLSEPGHDGKVAMRFRGDLWDVQGTASADRKYVTVTFRPTITKLAADGEAPLIDQAAVSTTVSIPADGTLLMRAPLVRQKVTGVRADEAGRYEVVAEAVAPRPQTDWVYFWIKPTVLIAKELPATAPVKTRAGAGHLVPDPVAAIWRVLPPELVVQRVAENSHPSYLEEGDGLMIQIGLPADVLARAPHKQEETLVVWVMPAEYGGRDPNPGAPRQEVVSRKVAALSDAAIFMWPGDGGELGRKVLAAIVTDGPAALPGTRPATAPAASRLEFRIVPNGVGSSRGPTYPMFVDKTRDEFAKAARAELAANGPAKVPPADGKPLAWCEVAADSLPGDALVGQWQGRKYVLLFAARPLAMLPVEDGKTVWGLKRAYVGKDNDGNPAVVVEFDQPGADRFTALTKENVGNSLAILVDGKVIACPRIMNQIGGTCTIGGHFAQQQAQDLAKALTAGMLPADKAPATHPATGPAARRDVQIVDQVELSDKDDAPAGLYVGVPPYDVSYWPGPKWIYERAAAALKQGTDATLLVPELVARLECSYAPRGTLEVAEQYVEGDTITIRLRYVDEDRDMSRRGPPFIAVRGKTPLRSVYVWGEKMPDLPPGKYTVVLELVEYLRENGKLVVAPKFDARRFEHLTTAFTVPGQAGAPPLDPAAEQRSLDLYARYKSAVLKAVQAGDKKEAEVLTDECAKALGGPLLQVHVSRLIAPDKWDQVVSKSYSGRFIALPAIKYASIDKPHVTRHTSEGVEYVLVETNSTGGGKYADDVYIKMALAPEPAASQPADPAAETRAKDLVAKLSNADVKWDGDWIGLKPEIAGQSAKDLLTLGRPALPALLGAMQDKDKFAAAHVLMTKIVEPVFQYDTAAEWNGLRVELTADNRTVFFPEQIPALIKQWRPAATAQPATAPATSRASVDRASLSETANRIAQALPAGWKLTGAGRTTAPSRWSGHTDCEWLSFKHESLQSPFPPGLAQFTLWITPADFVSRLYESPNGQPGGAWLAWVASDHLLFVEGGMPNGDGAAALEKAFVSLGYARPADHEITPAAVKTRFDPSTRPAPGKALPGAELTVARAMGRGLLWAAVCEASNAPSAIEPNRGVPSVSQWFLAKEALAGDPVTTYAKPLNYQYRTSSGRPGAMVPEHALAKGERVIWIVARQDHEEFGVKALPDTPENRAAVKAATASADRDAIAAAVVRWGQSPESGPYLKGEVLYLLESPDWSIAESDKLHVRSRADLQRLKKEFDSYAINEITIDRSFATVVLQSAVTPPADPVPFPYSGWRLQLRRQGGNWVVEGAAHAVDGAANPPATVPVSRPATGRASRHSNAPFGMSGVPVESTAKLVSRDADGVLQIKIKPRLYASERGCTMVETEHGAASQLYYVVQFTIEHERYYLIWDVLFGGSSRPDLDAEREYDFSVKPLAIAKAGENIPCTVTRVSLDGKVLLDRTSQPAAETPADPAVASKSAERAFLKVVARVKAMEKDYAVLEGMSKCQPAYERAGGEMVRAALDFRNNATEWGDKSKEPRAIDAAKGFCYLSVVLSKRPPEGLLQPTVTCRPWNIGGTEWVFDITLFTDDAGLKAAIDELRQEPARVPATRPATAPATTQASAEAAVRELMDTKRVSFHLDRYVQLADSDRPGALSLVWLDTSGSALRTAPDQGFDIDKEQVAKLADFLAKSGYFTGAAKGDPDHPKEGQVVLRVEQWWKVLTPQEQVAWLRFVRELLARDAAAETFLAWQMVEAGLAQAAPAEWEIDPNPGEVTPILWEAGRGSTMSIHRKGSRGVRVWLMDPKYAPIKPLKEEEGEHVEGKLTMAAEELGTWAGHRVFVWAPMGVGWPNWREDVRRALTAAYGPAARKQPATTQAATEPARSMSVEEVRDGKAAEGQVVSVVGELSEALPPAIQESFSVGPMGDRTVFLASINGHFALKVSLPEADARRLDGQFVIVKGRWTNGVVKALDVRPTDPPPTPQRINPRAAKVLEALKADPKTASSIDIDYTPAPRQPPHKFVRLFMSDGAVSVVSNSDDNLELAFLSREKMSHLLEYMATRHLLDNALSDWKGHGGPGYIVRLGGGKGFVIDLGWGRPEELELLRRQLDGDAAAKMDKLLAALAEPAARNWGSPPATTQAAERYFSTWGIGDELVNGKVEVPVDAATAERMFAGVTDGSGVSGDWEALLPRDAIRPAPGARGMPDGPKFTEVMQPPKSRQPYAHVARFSDRHLLIRISRPAGDYLWHHYEDNLATLLAPRSKALDAAFNLPALEKVWAADYRGLRQGDSVKKVTQTLGAPQKTETTQAVGYYRLHYADDTVVIHIWGEAILRIEATPAAATRAAEPVPIQGDRE